MKIIFHKAVSGENRLHHPIYFNRPHLTGKEIDFIVDAHQNGQLAGDGKYTKLSSRLIAEMTNAEAALLTHSCTAALEMMALLLDISPGDEIIMPSFTFVSTANAFVLRGAVPIFVDVDDLTFNLLPTAVENAITSKTKAIVAVHYAGVSCDMDHLLAVANSAGIPVVEDAAQGLMSSYKTRPLGSLGIMGAISFHETKNLISGEGGSLLINDPSLVPKAEIIREKGTNRSSFFRGEVDKYTWVEVGSSFLPGELIAAFLYAQLKCANDITSKRIEVWRQYHSSLEDLEARGLLKRQFIPDFCSHNAHMYFIVLAKEISRDDFLSFLKSKGVYAVFHYVPLHDSPAGRRYGESRGLMNGTSLAAEKLVRLPMGYRIDVQRVVAAIKEFFSQV